MSHNKRNSQRLTNKTINTNVHSIVTHTINKTAVYLSSNCCAVILVSIPLINKQLCMTRPGIDHNAILGNSKEYGS